MIKNLIADFLKDKLKLTLSEEKTKITNLLTDQAEFLGFLIRIHRPKENKRVVAKVKGTIRKLKLAHNVMEILMPFKKILNKLIEASFVRKIVKEHKTRYIPIAKTPWISLDHHGILARYN